MRTRTNRLRLAAVASVMAFALVGCGGDDGGAKVPTAGDGSSTASGGSGTTAGSGGEGGSGAGDDVAAYVEAQRKWVACLRENGVDAPDPDSKGQVDFGGGDAVRTMKKDPKFQKAVEKCAPLSKPVPESVEKDNQPKLSAEQIKTKREYAECMRKNGAPDFPDPGPDGYGDNDAEWDQTSAGAQRASRICGPIVGVPATPPVGKG